MILWALKIIAYEIIRSFYNKTKKTGTKNLLGLGFTLECRAAVYRLYTESTRVRVKFFPPTEESFSLFYIWKSADFFSTERKE